MLLDKFDNLLLVFCKLLFSPILMVCRKRRADIRNPQAFICKQTVFIICLFKAPNPLLQGRGLSGMRFDKTSFSISPVEQIACQFSRSRFVIRSDKRNPAPLLTVCQLSRPGNAVPPSPECSHCNFSSWTHIMIIPLTPSSRNRSIPVVSSSFSPIGANEHHPKSLISAFHFDASQHLTSKICSEAVQHDADDRRMIWKRLLFCHAICRYFQCLWHFLMFDYERPFSRNSCDQPFLCKELYRFLLVIRLT